MTIFPVKTSRWLNYFESQIAITSGAGSAGTYIFSANGLYDPNITSTGHQPMGFDQMMLFYEHYAVRRARISITNIGSDATNCSYWSVSRNAGTTPTTAYETLVENGNIKYAVMPTAANNSEVGKSKLSMDMDIANFAGVLNIQDADDYRGSVAGNPAEQSYFHISVWNPVNTSVVINNLSVLIEYEAWFSEPRKLTGS